MTRWLPFEYLLPLYVSEILTVIGFLLALVLLATVLKSNRPPQSTIAWLLSILLLPYVGVPLYLMFGGRKMRRMAGRKGRVYERDGVEPEGEFGLGAEKLLRSFGVPPASRGNRVELVTSGVDAYREMMRIIDSAERTLHVTTYVLGRDAVGEAVVARLARRAAEGVEVQVLLDAVGSWWTGHRFVRPIVAAGGRVAYFMPVLHIPFRGRSNLRSHRKIVVADSRVALTGGMNIAEEYLGPVPVPDRWRDVSLVVEGPAAFDLDALFRSDWAFATGGGTAELDLSLARATSPAGGDTPVQVVASGPDVQGDPLYESLISLLFAARKRIWVVTPYFVPDEILLRALELAARRGVDVRLLIPYRSNHLAADLARVGYLRQIDNAGGVVLRYRSVMLHAKLILIDDGLAIVGSANMDMRSLFLNYEVALFLYSAERVREADAWIRALIPLCRTGLTRPNVAIELLENVVRLVSPLL
jgi:cardiolipin synthase A/B